MGEQRTATAASGSVLARKREATCNAILDASSQLIVEKGVDGFTLSDVAKRGQINRALIYHYFKSRDNLVFETIRHIVYRYEKIRPELAPEAIERTARMQIEHPEIGRFFFQLLLAGRPLPSLSQPLFDAIEALERLRKERAPSSPFDAAFAVISTMLVQMSWAFARQEIARHLGIGVEEADERFIAQLRRTASLGLQALNNNT